MQFGMPTLIENHTLKENAALCEALGLRFIELNMNFPEYQVDRLEQTDELVRIAEQHHLYYTVHLDENLNIADFNPLVTKAYLETVRRTILAAKALLPLRDRYGDPAQPLTLNMHMHHGDRYGDPAQPLTLNMHMHHGIYITLPDRKVQMYERNFETYMQSFDVIRSLCEEWIGDSSIMMAVENTDGFRDYEKKMIAYLLESKKFGLTWDIGHSKAILEADVSFLMEHQDKLIHFHIHDGTETPPRNHLALGDGEIDLYARLKLAAERNARCVLETKTISAPKQSVRWLRNNWEGSRWA